MSHNMCHNVMAEKMHIPRVVHCWWRHRECIYEAWCLSVIMTISSTTISIHVCISRLKNERKWDRRLTLNNPKITQVPIRQQTNDHGGRYHPMILWSRQALIITSRRLVQRIAHPESHHNVISRRRIKLRSSPLGIHTHRLSNVVGTASITMQI